MALTLVTAPTAEPVTLEELKDQLRVEHSDEDARLVQYGLAARELIEAQTGRRLMSQTWDLVLDSFDDEGEWIRHGEIWLPYPPVSSVTSITYLDTAGASQTWASAKYVTELPTGPLAARARIYPAYGEVYPSTRGIPKAVTVRFVCGYASAEAVPELLKVAILEAARAQYERDAPLAERIHEWVDRQVQPYTVAQAW